jgi:hypothetical protein
MFGWSFQQQAKQLNLGSAVLEAVKSMLKLKQEMEEGAVCR